MELLTVIKCMAARGRGSYCPTQLINYRCTYALYYWLFTFCYDV